MPLVSAAHAWVFCNLPILTLGMFQSSYTGLFPLFFSKHTRFLCPLSGMLSPISFSPRVPSNLPSSLHTPSLSFIYAVHLCPFPVLPLNSLYSIYVFCFLKYVFLSFMCHLSMYYVIADCHLHDPFSREEDLIYFFL